MMTVDEALKHTGTIVEALQQVLAQAMAHARTVTQAGQAIDEHQVHCERLAYRATELRAMHDLLHYATDVQQHAPHESLAAFMALALPPKWGRNVAATWKRRRMTRLSDAVLRTPWPHQRYVGLCVPAATRPCYDTSARQCWRRMA